VQLDPGRYRKEWHVHRVALRLFASEAVRVVEEHAKERPGTPLFLYYAMHDTHAPLEVPWRFAEPYARVWPDDEKRFTFSGMVSFVDEAVLNLTAALKRTEMWENSLFVWTNDNGSPIFVGGSNHPLRGGKGSNWEGGVRVATFVAGGLLPASMAGRTHDGLIHIADWLATFCAIAGIDPHAGEPEPVAPLDSLNAWPWISGDRPSNVFECDDAQDPVPRDQLDKDGRRGMRVCRAPPRWMEAGAGARGTERLVWLVLAECVPTCQ
jgi:arylsulfatase A-like enzyme